MPPVVVRAISGLALINGAVPTEHQGGVLSALYLCAYLSLGVVAFVLGVVATQCGRGLAVDLGAAVITRLSLHDRSARNSAVARPRVRRAILRRRPRQVGLSANQTRRSSS